MEKNTKIIGIRTHKKVTFIVAWVVLLVLIAGFAGLNIAQYRKYYEMQDMALISMGVAMDMAGEGYDDETREAMCEDFYYELASRNYSNIEINGVTIDMSDVNETQRDKISAARDLFVTAFDYPYWDVQYIFKYTDQMEFSMDKIIDPQYDYLLNNILFYGTVVYFLLLLVSQLIHAGRYKATIEVCSDTVICSKKPGKSVSIPISRITKVKRTGYKGVSIKSPGKSFKITMLKNQVEIVDAITDLMNRTSTMVEPAPVASAISDNADQLMKFKELLDSGVITQEEFDAKKKDILGL